MYCKKCGKEIEDGTKFCPNCGMSQVVDADFTNRFESTSDVEVSDKSKIGAGLLQIFLGGFGIGRFYLGYIGIGVAQLLLSFCCGIGAIWGFIDGICMLCNSDLRDADGKLVK